MVDCRHRQRMRGGGEGGAAPKEAWDVGWGSGRRQQGEGAEHGRCHSRPAGVRCQVSWGWVVTRQEGAADSEERRAGSYQCTALPPFGTAHSCTRTRIAWPACVQSTPLVHAQRHNGPTNACTAPHTPTPAPTTDLRVVDAVGPDQSAQPVVLRIVQVAVLPGARRGGAVGQHSAHVGHHCRMGRAARGLGTHAYRC